MKYRNRIGMSRGAFFPSLPAIDMKTDMRQSGLWPFCTITVLVLLVFAFLFVAVASAFAQDGRRVSWRATPRHPSRWSGRGRPFPWPWMERSLSCRHTQTLGASPVMKGSIRPNFRTRRTSPVNCLSCHESEAFKSFRAEHPRDDNQGGKPAAGVCPIATPRTRSGR